MVDDRFHPLLLDVVRETIRRGALDGMRPTLDHRRFPKPLRDQRCASFVTLSHRNSAQLRGCCGSTTPVDTLLVDLIENAWRTAFRDPRFKPVQAHELEELFVEVSLLSSLQSIPAGTEAELIAWLQARRVGLLIDDGMRRATFLPKVWEVLPDPADFLAHLKQKAGLAPGEWPAEMRIYGYTTRIFGGTLVPGMEPENESGRLRQSSD